MRLLASAAAVSVLLTPLPALAQPSATDDHPTLTVRGTATVVRGPDHAEMWVAVVSRDATPEAVISAHGARIAQAAVVLARVKADGVAIDDGTFSLSEQRPQGMTCGAVPVGYRAETLYRLAFSNLDRFDATATAIVSSGLFEVTSTVFSSSDRDAALDDARRAAVKDARQQANLYADAAGIRLDGIDRITAPAPDDLGGRGWAVQGSVDARGASVGIVPPKTISFGASVTVTWRIAPR